MKKYLYSAMFILLSSLFIIGCDDDETKMNGTVRLSLTDSPIDAENVKSVVINIIGIEYRKDDGEWMTFEEFEGPQEVNLLDLTEGKSILLGEFDAGPGTYTGLRFKLEAPEKGSGKKSNPGSYIEFMDESVEPLFVPSGGQSGYKTIGEFTVPSNGTVEVTADFDVRKSVVKAGNSGLFLLKPVIRIVVNNQAGSIEGTIDGVLVDDNLVVYLYEDGVYTEEEAADPDEEETRFPNAISSDDVEEGQFVLALLAPGTYDIVVVSLGESGEFEEVVGLIEDISVESLDVNELTVSASELTE